MAKFESETGVGRSQCECVNWTTQGEMKNKKKHDNHFTEIYAICISRHVKRASELYIKT